MSYPPLGWWGKGGGTGGGACRSAGIDGATALRGVPELFETCGAA